MKIDLHVHTSERSRCARSTEEEMARGYNGRRFRDETGGSIEHFAKVHRGGAYVLQVGPGAMGAAIGLTAGAESATLPYRPYAGVAQLDRASVYGTRQYLVFPLFPLSLLNLFAHTCTAIAPPLGFPLGFLGGRD